MFVADGKLQVQYFPQGILITILNYSKFQAFSVESSEGSTKGNTQGCSEGSTEGRHSINNKEIKNKFLRSEEENGRRPSFRDPDSFED